MPDSSKDRISTVEHIYVTVIILFPNLINKRRKSASLRKCARALQSPGTGLGGCVQSQTTSWTVAVTQS